MASSREGGTPTLQARLADPGFTPSLRLIDELIALLVGEDEDVAKAAERAILRIEAQYAARVVESLVKAVRTASRPGRGRLTHLLGALAVLRRDPANLAFGWLLEGLGDADPKTRRAASRALGNLDKAAITTDELAQVDAALVRAFDAAAAEEDRKVFGLALGKLGSEAARERLRGGGHVRAAVIADRELARRVAAVIDPSQNHPDLALRFHVRSGLEDIVKGELGTTFGKPRFVAPGLLQGSLGARPLADALAVRTALKVGFPLEPRPWKKELAEEIVAALAQPSVIALFRTFTKTEDGAPIRFRLELLQGGNQRSPMWRLAELVRERVPGLVNDPKESTWEVVVDAIGTAGSGTLKIELVPRAFEDLRFAYRKDLVAASSHPTVAAALARLVPRRHDDVVWDPFCGAGAELVERANLGPYARLLGTDTDPAAIAAARANTARAALSADTLSLVEADACTHTPKGVTSILTNPPMGRRVERGTHADLLERFVSHAARVLVPGGSLVWIVPEPKKRIQERAEAAGLLLDRGVSLDMGGFSAELSVYRKV